jgi:stearoyl-CoA desaturase (delta-9 desaturase)
MTLLDQQSPAAATLRAPDETARRPEAPGQPARVLQEVPKSLARARAEQLILGLVIGVPLLAVLAAIPVLWGRHIALRDVIVGSVLYAVTGHGITIGYHRYFTHSSFKANRVLRVLLAVAGSMAIEGPVTRWVADHRRHHAFSDKAGDPHSPWRYGETVPALLRGVWHAHVGWLFDVEQTNQQRFAPDLLADRDIGRVNKLFALWAFISLALPAVLGYLLSGFSVAGALQCFFWAGLVRVFLLHHVTWSINSICHTFGSRPFQTRDKAANVWPLAILSFGESWHNLHHAEPTSARHGVDRWQIDSSARLIALFEWFGWARDVRWPRADRLAARRRQPVGA